MRKLIRKLIPKPLSRILLRHKYEKESLQRHIENIGNGRVASAVCDDSKQGALLRDYFDDTFGGTLSVEGRLFYLREAAVIKVPAGYDEYLHEVGPKTRNMIKKAEKSGVVCKPFEWNDHLEEIFGVNTSSDVRQGHRMTKHYREYPKRVETEEKSAYSILHMGGFFNDKLVGYVELYVCGNFSFVNRILGHKDHLGLGVMNALIAACVEYSIANHIDYINYLMMDDKEHDTLSGFKYRSGFRPYSIAAFEPDASDSNIPETGGSPFNSDFSDA